MPSRLRLQVMGPLRVWRDGIEIDAGPRQQRCLLALLLLREGRPVGMSELVGLLWDTEPPPSAVNVIHKYVGALRRLLEPDIPLRSAGSYLLRHGTGYRFAAGPDMLDLVRFRQLTAAAKASADDEEAFGHYLGALALGHGSAGATLVDSAAATAAFAGVDAEFFEAVVAAAESAVRVRRPVEVLAPLRLAADMGRLNEPVHASLITTLAAAGHQAEALTAYGAIRDRLDDELGIDPGHDLREAQRLVLTQGAAAGEEPHPAVPLVPPAQLPPDQPLFVGRTEELCTLHGLLTGNDRRPGLTVVAVDGMGGVGKSTLVTHFAHQVAGRFTDGQLYLDLQGHEVDGGVSAADALRSLLYGLGVRAADVPDTFDALAGAYRSLTAGKKFVVVLDNVSDSAQVRPLLPNSAGSLVLITSRRPLAGLAASDGAHLFRAYLPDLPGARELLRARLGPGNTDDTATLDEVIELCGRLPLALAILGARMRARPRLSLRALLAELRDGSLSAFHGGGGLSFAWSYRQLGPRAARLFRLFAVTLPPGVTAEAYASLAGGGETRDDLDELVEAALLEEDEQGRFTSHVLVKAYANELLADDEREAATTRLLQHYLYSSLNAEVVLDCYRKPVSPPPPLPGVVPEKFVGYHEGLAWFTANRDVLTEAVRVAADLGYGIVPWHLAITLQKCLEWYGFFGDWEGVMRSALRAAEATEDAEGEANVRRSLAGARWFLGADPEEVLALLFQALRTYEDRNMLAEQAMVHVNVHAVQTSLGRHDLALASSETAVAVNRRRGDIRAEVRSLDSNGQSLTRLGRHEEAAEVLRQALDLNARIDHRHEDASIRVAIARNLASTGSLSPAIEQLRLAASAADAMNQGPYRFEASRYMAELLIAAGDRPAARVAFARAREALGSFQDGGPAHMRAGLAALAEQLQF